MKRGIFLLLASSLPLLTSARAEETGEAKKRFGLITQMEASSNLYGTSTEKHSSSLGIYLYPSYDLGAGYKARIALESSQDLTGEQEFKLITSDAGLTYSGWELNPFLNLGITGWTTIPLATAVANTSLITSIRAVPRLSFDMTRVFPLSGFYEASLGRAFHSYFTTAEGKSNNRYTIAQRMVLNVPFSGKFTLDTDLRFRSAWSYAGNLSNTFVWGESVSYNASNALGFSVGVSNEAGILKANGYESNIALFNQATTQLAASVSYSY